MPNFNNTYTKLPAEFYTPQNPETIPNPQLIQANQNLAKQLGIDTDWLVSDGGIAAWSGNKPPAGAEPIATVYAGHQFGHWNPQLGDGRAILLGEVLAEDGQRYDIQLKGSGRTPYSRGGDGKAPLGPVLREYIVSEAMVALDIPTTRALAAVSTGENVFRETALPGAVLTRVAKSHIRIGTFEYFAARGDHGNLKVLADYTIERHYPDAAEADNPYLALLENVITQQAKLIAQWQSVGFIHGVMNTDNMLVSGETIDYGPCAFMDEYHPGKVFSSIDRQGRYAYGNQPNIAHWNLASLAQALLSLLSDDKEQAVTLAQNAVDGFADQFLHHYQTGMARKIGLQTAQDGDDQLISDLLERMAAEKADFTLTFRQLSQQQLPAAFAAWQTQWEQRLAQESTTPAEQQAQMLAVNPVYIPRNHQVEVAIQAATEQHDFTVFNTLLEVLEKPFTEIPAYAHFAVPPTSTERVTQTFCGT